MNRKFGAIITADQFMQVLEDAGVIAAGQPYQRVVIDAPSGGLVTVYVQLLGDDRLLGVNLEAGLEVVHEAQDKKVDATDVRGRRVG
jgi:hypothetical protein